MSIPARFDIEIYQGSAWEMDLEFLDENGSAETITAHTFFMQIREKPGGHILVDLAVGTGITITDGAAGLLAINLTSAQTALLYATSAEYDLKHTASGVSQYEMFGNVTIGQRITQ